MASTIPSILIVHSDRKTQRTVQRILGVTGYRVDVADDLDQAVRLLQHSRPVLVVVGLATVVPVPVATWDTVLGDSSTGSCEEHAQVLAP